MTREIKNGKVAFKCGQFGRMDHHVWQVVPGTCTNNTVREKKYLVASMVQWCNASIMLLWYEHSMLVSVQTYTEAISVMVSAWPNPTSASQEECYIACDMLSHHIAQSVTGSRGLLLLRSFRFLTASLSC